MSDKPRYNPAIHHRRSIRVKGYDYSLAGAYFITLCAHEHECLFGEIMDGAIRLNEYGEIVREEWEKSAQIRAEIALGEYVIMPNHFHAIVWIKDLPPRRGDRPVAPAVAPTPVVSDACKIMESSVNGPKPKSIGALMAGFKSAVTRRINENRRTPGVPVWQRNYWEHIIRDEDSYNQIYTYIVSNPDNWQTDKLYLDGHS